MTDHKCAFPGCDAPGVNVWSNGYGETSYMCEWCHQKVTNMTPELLEPGGRERHMRFLQEHGVLPGVRGSVDDA